MVYVPGGTPFRVKAPSSPVTAKKGWGETPIQARIQGWTLQVTGNMTSWAVNFLNLCSARGGCDSFQAWLTSHSAWTLWLTGSSLSDFEILVFHDALHVGFVDAAVLVEPGGLGGGGPLGGGEAVFNPDEDVAQGAVGVDDYGLGLLRGVVLALALRIRGHVDEGHGGRVAFEENAAGDGAGGGGIDMGLGQGGGRFGLWLRSARAGCQEQRGEQAWEGFQGLIFP